MRLIMNRLLQILLLLPVFISIVGCDGAVQSDEGALLADDDFERGPNNGRMLRDGEFAIELAIIDAGMPPEFRVWASRNGAAVDVDSVDVTVTLERLGGRDVIEFESQGAYLRGNQLVYEPHSFAVTVTASHLGRNSLWQYNSFEGRTQIAPEMAGAFGIETEVSGAATLKETISVYGTIVSDPAQMREVRARFDGAIQAVDVALGEMVERGQRLATVESNESLRTFDITAPISGTIMERSANAGEQTAGRRLFAIVDTSSVRAELSIFPGDRSRVAVGQAVQIAAATGGSEVGGTISLISPVANVNQSVSARVTLANEDGRWALGMYVTGTISVAEFAVPLAVRRTGLQTFRDFTVVYAQFGNEYEVRMLDLGRTDDEWAEVLGGLEPGTRYVTTNSYVLKADIEKAGAAHDH